MVIYLPCKLGERFAEQKIKDWKDGKRVYAEGAERTLKGFDAFDCTTRCLAIPTIHTDGGFLSYDPLGEFSQEYKLSDRGFPSGKIGRLHGISIENGYLLADFVTNDRHEHLRYVIKDNLHYAGLDEETTESIIEYDNEAQGEKTQREQEGRENIKALKEIKTKVEEPKKEKSLKNLIKTKIKRVPR